MPKAFLSKTKELLFKFEGLKLKKEFIPIVKLDKDKLKASKLFLSFDGEEVLLSEFIDNELRRIDLLIVETEERNIKLPFRVDKGNAKSEDDEGIIDVRISLEDKEIEIKSREISAKYGSFFEIELDIKKREKIEFYLDFYSRDDEDKEKGEIENIHCGRVKVFFNYSVTTDWYNIPPVIPKEKFVGWEYPGVRKNCFHYALEQLRQVGHWVKPESWLKGGGGSNKRMNDYIYQLYLEEDVAGMKKEYRRSSLRRGWSI